MQASEERNYHIFYQMCAAKDEDVLKDLSLEGPDTYFYMNQGDAPDIDGVDDLKEFGYTTEAFKLLGFTDKDQSNIFKILGGILHLGNVEIESGSGRGDSETSTIENGDQALKTMAKLLEVTTWFY